jgi:hypothetical protein
MQITVRELYKEKSNGSISPMNVAHRPVAAITKVVSKEDMIDEKLYIGISDDIESRLLRKLCFLCNGGVTEQ